MAYRPDGTLEVKDNQTGQIILVKPEELSTYGVSQDTYNIKKQQYEQQVQAYGATGEVKTPEAASIIAGAKEQGIIAPKSAAQQTQEKVAETALIYKNQAMDLATQLKSMSTIGITGAKHISLARPLGINLAFLNRDVQNVQATRDQLINTLKVVARGAIVGQGQGPISDTEQQMLAASATKLENKELSDTDFQNELTNIIDVLNGKYRDPNFKPILEDKKKGGLGNAYEAIWPEGSRKSLSGAIGDVITGEPMRDITVKDSFIDVIVNAGLGADYWKDISTSLVLKGKTGQELNNNLGETMDMAERAFERAEQEQDPEIKRRLEKVGFSVMNEVSKQRGEITKMFSKDINIPIPLRGLLYSLGIVSLATDVLALKDTGVKVTKSVGEKILTKVPEKIITLTEKPSLTGKVIEATRKYSLKSLLARRQAEEAAKSTIQVSTNNIFKAGQELAKTDPDIAKAMTKYGPSIKETKTAGDLVKNLSHWGDVAYTKAGDVAGSAKAQLFNEFYHAGVEELKTIAPKAYKYRTLLKYTFDLPKTTGRWLWKVFIARGALGGF